MRNRWFGGLIACLVVVGVSACGGDDPDPDTESGSPTATSQEPSPDTSTESAEPSTDEPSEDSSDAATVVAVADSTYGEILVDGEGRTLYMFDPDAQGASTCYDQCATAWPPYVAEGEPGASGGADDSKLGTTERTDGTIQVTYDGWPLYYWQDDAAPGDVLGQAVNDVWWVLDADGEPIRTPPAT